LIHHPKVKGSSPAIGTDVENGKQKSYFDLKN
jgi:hypothetical protein